MRHEVPPAPRIRVVVACVLVTPLWASTITGIVAFGDSLTDTGNLFAATGGAFPPSPYSAGRFSNGPVWVEHLAAQLNLPELTPSVGGGTNYAWGGAETGLTGLSNRGTPNIGLQITQYLAAHANVAEPDRLFVLWGGANDFLNAGQTNPSVSVGNISTLITRLATAGAERFLVPNLPSLGETPRHVGTANEAPLNALTDQFNSQLAAALDEREASLGISIIRIDTFSLFQQILNDPTSFGFTNTTGTALQVPGGGVGTGPVVPNPDEYVFWDDVHPSSVTHRLLGDEAVAAAVPEPSAVVLIISGGLCLLGYGRCRRGRLVRAMAAGCPNVNAVGLITSGAEAANPEDAICPDLSRSAEIIRIHRHRLIQYRPSRKLINRLRFACYFWYLVSSPFGIPPAWHGSRQNGMRTGSDPLMTKTVRPRIKQGDGGDLDSPASDRSGP